MVKCYKSFRWTKKRFPLSPDHTRPCPTTKSSQNGLYLTENLVRPRHIPKPVTAQTLTHRTYSRDCRVEPDQRAERHSTRQLTRRPTCKHGPTGRRGRTPRIVVLESVSKHSAASNKPAPSSTARRALEDSRQSLQFLEQKRRDEPQNV